MCELNEIPRPVFHLAEQIFADVEDFITIDSETEKWELVQEIAKRIHFMILSRTNFLTDQMEAANERCFRKQMGLG